MSTVNYEIRATDNPLQSNDLYEGRVVCFNDVQLNPNRVGILRKNLNSNTSVVWLATINNINYNFDKNGYVLSDGGRTNTRLYGIVTTSGFDLNVDTNKAITRGSGTSEVTSTISTLTPKDHFAICALEALIGSIPNAIAMDDGTILMLATKSYKIAQAMLRVATLARAVDEPTEESEDPIEIDKNNLSSDTDKILYNISEAIKENTRVVKEEGVIIRTTEDTGPINIATTEPIETEVSNIDKVKFDGIPSININNTPSVNVANTPSVNINNTPNVSVSNTVNTRVTNMPNVPTEPVRISGTVSVDNFPSSSSE